MARPLEQRFWEKVDRRGPDECWEWQGKVGNHGYGVIWLDATRTRTTHRVAFELAHGAIKKTCVCHRCDNRLCCNPAHLFQGSRADNNRDMFAKGRNKAPGLKGSRHGCAKLSEQQVAQIRARVAAGEVQRRVAEEFGVHYTTVNNIVKRDNWRHV